MLDLSVPIQTNEGKDRQGSEDSREQVSRALDLESDLWKAVRELRNDLEMLKEEIAQLRSEFRSMMPKDHAKDTVAKRTVNPFWITDAQLEKQEPD